VSENTQDELPVLVVDDEQSMREFLSVMLKRQGIPFELATSAKEAIAFFGPGRFRLVLTDLRMDESEAGLDILRHVRETDPACQVIVMTAYASTETAISAIRQGAYDYINKPFKLEEVRSVIDRALEKYALVSENLYLRSQLDSSHFDEIIGRSDAIKSVFDLIGRVAPTKTTVLLTGESGTGKELFARAIHKQSGLDGAFVPVNCGAIPENLIESELFGYTKGAFTGASQDRDGLFVAASSGTLFLDEVGELPAATQVKLLRALQEKKVKPVGSNSEQPVDVRIVAATNRNLQEEVDAGRFREDLYYRLNVISIELPPLRDREGDIRLLIEYYVKRFAEEIGNHVEGVDAEALRALVNHDYPGNVRELQNIVERAVTLERSTLITVDSLPQSIATKESGGDESVLNLPPEGVDIDAVLERVERALVEQALERTEGNRTEAAKLLKITFRSMRYRLQKHGID
jgi:two-component system response regulator PilR (NtrC family)